MSNRTYAASSLAGTQPAEATAPRGRPSRTGPHAAWRSVRIPPRSIASPSPGTSPAPGTSKGGITAPGTGVRTGVGAAATGKPGPGDDETSGDEAQPASTSATSAIAGSRAAGRDGVDL